MEGWGGCREVEVVLTAIAIDLLEEVAVEVLIKVPVGVVLLDGKNTLLEEFR